MKVFILNSNEFYNHLLNHLDKMLEEGFLYDDWRKRIVVCADVVELEKNLFL
jgi:predicted Rossmann-fold nucleotide-binding protein